MPKKEVQEDSLQRMGLRHDPELYTYVLNAYETSRKYMENRGIFERINRYKKMYENDPYTAQGISREGDLSECKIAIAYDIIETGLPIATGRMPIPDIDPMINSDNEEYLAIKDMQRNAANELEASQADEAMEVFREKLDAYADKTQRELLSTFKKTDMASKMRMGYREKGKTGSFIMKSVLAANGEIINQPVDYTTIFPSPNCDSIEAHTEQGEPFCYAPIVSTRRIKKKYNIDHLHPKSVGDYDEDRKFKFRHETGFAAAVMTRIKNAVTGEEKTKEGYGLLIECYMPDDSEVDFEDYVYGEDGEKIYEGDEAKTEKKKRKKFPSGRKIVTIVKGHQNWILAEEECKYPTPPFIMTKNAEQLGDFFGITDIQMVEDLIMRLNISASNVNDNLRLTGNPKLVRVTGSQAVTEDGEVQEYTNEIGGIYETTMPNGVYYLTPPPLGVDVKWWTDFIKGWIDRITHLSDALRGFNEFARDSGRKVQELRIAASNTFKPKLDEQVEFCNKLYKHWTWIIQNLRSDVILQKIEDEDGKSNFEEFQPSDGRSYVLGVDVSALSILPKDVLANQEMAVALYDRRVPMPDGTDRGLISVEHLLDIFGDAGFEDVQRAKDYNAREQRKADVMMQKNRIYEQFQEAAAMVAQIVEGGGENTEEEDSAVLSMIEMVRTVPELMATNEFMALPDRIKLAIVAAVAQIGMIDEGEEDEKGINMA